MFGRRISKHGRRMGDIRSAQQKCIRRGMLEPLILLHLEHLLSEPDFGLAALTRMQVIAAEDIGAGALGLLPALMELQQGWASLGRYERARRLIQASHMCVDCEASRFVPCWIVSLLKGVEIPGFLGYWRSLDALLRELEHALSARDLQASGLIIEEIWLRHPIEKEDELPASVGFSRDVMREVWRIIELHSGVAHRAVVAALRKRFGTPSQENTGSRLFLYLAVVSVVLRPEVVKVSIPKVDDAEVKEWLSQAEQTYFPIPSWMYDRHTSEGRRLERGYEHFFEEATWLARPSGILGAEREEEAKGRALSLYLAEEAAYGRQASSAHMRRRWRAQASMVGARLRCA